MDGTGFLKTVSFGGFDKKDVLAYGRFNQKDQIFVAVNTSHKTSLGT